MKCNYPNIILKRVLPLLFMLSAVVQVSGQRQEQEANLKAAFIYNFTKYIDWDTTTLGNDFVIGVIGNSPVTESLMQIAKTNNVNNKRITVRRFSKPDDISYCNILFIPAKLPYPLESILKELGRGVLTISEETGYAQLGTAFNFVIRNDKLKFEANLKTINSEGLKAGSQLLKLAIIVE